jgi:hypothetical protein
MGNYLTKKKKLDLEKEKDKDLEKRRKIISTLNHRLTFAELCFRKTTDIFCQSLERKFYEKGYSIYDYPEFRHYVQSFNYGSGNCLFGIFLDASLKSTGFHYLQCLFGKQFNTNNYFEKDSDDVYNCFREIWEERFGNCVFSPGMIHTKMDNMFEKLLERIWKEFFINNNKYFSSWEKISIEADSKMTKKDADLLTLERAKEICKNILLSPSFASLKLANHVPEIYTYHVWQIIDLIVQLFPTLEEYCQINFLKLRQLSSPSSQMSLFYSDISMEQFLIFSNYYFPTEVAKIILDYDVLRPESSDIFFTRLLSFEKDKPKIF